MIKIEYYQSNLGVFIKNEWSMNSLYINDIPFTEGIARKGFRQFNIPSIDKVERKSSPTYETIGYKLKVVELASDKIPVYLKQEEVQPYLDDDGDTRWVNYEDIHMLYTVDSAQKESILSPVEYQLVCLGTLQVDNIESPATMTIMVKRPKYYIEHSKSCDLSELVTYSDLEQMLTPEFLLHERPCKLTSKQMYNIVRNWVKTNINPKCAEITSDYDFCFTVKRKLYHPPVEIKTEIKKQNGRSYATPKFNTRTKAYDSVQIFEMTWAGYRDNGGYEGYTCIPPLEGSSLKDISERLKYYLETLMEEINKELDKCSCCKGHGYVVKSISSNFEKEWGNGNTDNFLQN